MINNVTKVDESQPVEMLDFLQPGIQTVTGCWKLVSFYKRFMFFLFEAASFGVEKNPSQKNLSAFNLNGRGQQEVLSKKSFPARTYFTKDEAESNVIDHLTSSRLMLCV